MAEFKRIIITRKGQELMAKLMSGTGTLEFTRIGVSSNKYNDSQLESLTSLANIKQWAEISNVTMNNNQSVQVEGQVNNEELTAGYYMETIGLYAKDPDENEILYAVTNASTSDYMPPYNNKTVSGAFFKLNVTIGNADNVTLQVDPAAVATIGDIKRLEDKIINLEGFVGYSDEDILGLRADFENNIFARLAGAVNRTNGSSFDKFRMYGGRNRVNLSDTGIVNARFGEPSYVEDGTNGQVMVEQPKFYYKVVPLKTERITDGKGLHLLKADYYISDLPKPGFEVHPAFIKEDGSIAEFIYLSAYEGTIYDTSASAYLKNDEQVADFSNDKLSSVANAQPASGASQNLTRANARNLAQNRGAGWQQQTVAVASLTQLLFAIEYASFNMQSTLGVGITDATSETDNENESLLTGATSTLGNQSGEAENGAVTYRGEENFFGNIWKWVDGLNVEAQDLNNAHVALYNFADNTGAGSYKDIGFTLAKQNGYIKNFGYSEEFDWLFLPSKMGGNSSVPVGDYFWQNHSYSGWLVARLGGYWAHGASAGGFCWYVTYASSARARYIGARLQYTI